MWFRSRLVAGFLSAASSISKIIEEMPDRYTIEDGQFSTSFKANDEAIDAVEELGCTVYESFNMDLPCGKVEGRFFGRDRFHSSNI